MPGKPNKMDIITDINQLDMDGTYTYADYMKWRFDEYVELFRGKVMRISPAPLRQHQLLALRISSRLEQFLRRKKCQVYIAPFDVRFPKKNITTDEAIYTVVQPDVCIICDPEKLDRRGCIGAPDTIIEILSQGNVNRDIKQKFDLYQEHGVREYWIIAPGERTISVYHLNAAGAYELSGEYADPGPVPVLSLPDFSLEWSDIFED